MVMTIEPFLRENIDDHLRIEPFLIKKQFPIYLRESYNFYKMIILGKQCVLLEVLDGMPSINRIQKHVKQIENVTESQIVLYYKALSRHRRKILIENRIAFVIEDGQMYLPFLGLDLKKTQEYIKDQMMSFTTSAQVAYLYFMYHKEDILNTTEFAEKLGFSKMTASKALNDLYNANLLTYEIGGNTGRSKAYKRIPDPGYFLKGCDYLKTPVRKTVHTKEKPSAALDAGLYALAELSMMNPPDHMVLAIDIKELKEEQLEIVKNKDLIKDRKLVELQLWDYDPKLFSDKYRVDILSLYASLKDEKDERIEQALEEILRGE